MAPTATGSKSVLGAAGVRRVWAGAGPQCAEYRGGGISCGLAHSLLQMQGMTFELKLDETRKSLVVIRW